MALLPDRHQHPEAHQRHLTAHSELGQLGGAKGALSRKSLSRSCLLPGQSRVGTSPGQVGSRVKTDSPVHSGQGGLAPARGLPPPESVSQLLFSQRLQEYLLFLLPHGLLRRQIWPHISPSTFLPRPWAHYLIEPGSRVFSCRRGTCLMDG